jgi:hypothetical protein
LWQTLSQRKNVVAAAQVEARFKEAWKHADVTLALADY